MSIADKILQLSKQLYPTGRAFKMAADGYLEKLHTALAVSETEAYNNAVAIKDSLLPDNDNFTADDATDWERRLGLITNESVSLTDRKLAIKRKLNHPGTIKARQHYLYIQSQLQAAGFDVYVHENIPVQDPLNVVAEVGYGEHGTFEHGVLEHGDSLSYYSDLFEVVQHGEFEHGPVQHGEVMYLNKVVNNIDYRLDEYFSVGENYRSVFFIGGEVAGTFANVDADRKEQFRQLILKLKPAQTIAYLFINYI